MTALCEDRDRLKTLQNSPIAIYARRAPLNPDANTRKPEPYAWKQDAVGVDDRDRPT